MEYIPRSTSTEATIQAEFYHACKLANLECHLEHVVPKTQQISNKGCRFDAVIVVNNRIAAIIEIKKPNRKGRDPYWYVTTPKYKRYSQYGPPVLYVFGTKDIPFTLFKIKEIIKAIKN